MPSKSRIRVLRHHRDFKEATDEAAGLQIVTNVSFDGGEPEAVRLNLDSPNSSLRRSSQTIRFPRREEPFAIYNPAVLLSAAQLSDLQDNFAVVHEALGDRRLGDIPSADPIHGSILPMLQARSYEIAWIDSLLESLSMDSALYRSYLRHPKTVNLLKSGVTTEQGGKLLTDFQEAVELYSQIPELRAYSIQGNVEQDDIGPRGEQFRQWLQQNKTITSGDGTALEYVAYALRPLRMSGGRAFHWRLDVVGGAADPKGLGKDLRQVAVDLLLRFEGNPVWCEVKTQGDTWTSAALQQILFYGSMQTSGNQQRRCRRYFLDQFQHFRPWLGILVEERADGEFLADYDETLAFVRSPIAQNALREVFGGIVFGVLRETEGNWTLLRTEVIRW